MICNTISFLCGPCILCRARWEAEGQGIINYTYMYSSCQELSLAGPGQLLESGCSHSKGLHCFHTYEDKCMSGMGVSLNLDSGVPLPSCTAFPQHSGAKQEAGLSHLCPVVCTSPCIPLPSPCISYNFGVHSAPHPPYI